MILSPFFNDNIKLYWDNLPTFRTASFHGHTFISRSAEFTTALQPGTTNDLSPFRAGQQQPQPTTNNRNITISPPSLEIKDISPSFQYRLKTKNQSKQAKHTSEVSLRTANTRYSLRDVLPIKAPKTNCSRLVTSFRDGDNEAYRLRRK